MTTFSPIFFWDDYINNHPDLSLALVHTKTSTHHHYENHGYREKRNLYGNSYKFMLHQGTLFSVPPYINTIDPIFRQFDVHDNCQIAIKQYFESGLAITRKLQKLLLENDITTGSGLVCAGYGHASRHFTKIIPGIKFSFFDTNNDRMVFMSEYLKCKVDKDVSLKEKYKVIVLNDFFSTITDPSFWLCKLFSILDKSGCIVFIDNGEILNHIIKR